MPASLSPARARRRALAGFGLLVAAVVAVTALVVGTVSVVRWAWPDRACHVAVGDDDTADLTTSQVEQAARRVARASRRGEPGVLRPGRADDLRTSLAHLVDDTPLDDDRADARALLQALTGRARGALWCDHGGASRPASDKLGADGLVPRAEDVRRDITDAFGDLELGGFAPGGVRTGHMKGSAHYEGRAIDVFFRPIDPAHKRRGWALAQYLVANAERLRLETVIFDDQVWTADRATQGWRAYRVDTKGEDRRTARILEHRDHVHVDVAD